LSARLFSHTSAQGERLHRVKTWCNKKTLLNKTREYLQSKFPENDYLKKEIRQKKRSYFFLELKI